MRTVHSLRASGCQWRTRGKQANGILTREEKNCSGSSTRVKASKKVPDEYLALD